MTALALFLFGVGCLFMYAGFTNTNIIKELQTVVSGSVSS